MKLIEHGDPITAYPLCWPVAWPRNHAPEHNANFKRGLAEARNYLIDELGLMGATRIIISSNAELGRDGRPLARQRAIDDTGVAVYFELDGQQRCIPCDRWMRLEHNLNAIGLTINALRGIERWGTHDIITAAFAGFAALPAVSTSGESCWEVLGIAPNATREEIDWAFRLLAKTAHPDVGGDVEHWHRIRQAYDAARTVRS